MGCSQIHGRLGSASAVVLCVLATETYAQVSPGEGAGAEPSGPVPRHERHLDEVTVTANRREESNQRVPGAVSVVSGQALAKLGPADLQSVAALVPGLLFNRQANASIPFLRGVGTPVGEAGDEPSVALYIDEVYIPAGSASFANLTSIDHIEVDKGPQGTLFGRNATGGVVQVITKNPTDTHEWQFSGGYGNYDTWSADLYANGAIASHLMANVSLYWSNQSQGWGRNITTGTPAFRSRDYGGRTKLLWQGEEGTSALLSFDYDLTVTQQGLGFRAFPGTGSLDPLPPFPNGGIPPAPNYYDPNENFNSDGRDRQFGVSLKVSKDFENTRLISISAYRDTRADYLLDEDSGPLPLVNVQITTPETTFTQELRFASRASDHIDWIGGAFYFNDKAGFDPTHFTGAAFAPLPFANSYGTQTTHSYAVFAQARGSLGENTHLTLGGRYTRDERTEQAAATFGVSPVVPAPNSPQSMTWSSPTWRVVLDRQLTPDVLGYLGFNRGFKSGLFNPVVLPGASIDPPVDPETLDAYTIGLKSESEQHKVRLNVEGFYYNYKNIQVEQIVSAVSHITNAAKATIQGVDVDLSVLPLERLEVSASIEATQGHYDSFPDGTFFVYDPTMGGNCTFTAAVPCRGTVPPNYNVATGHWDLSGNHTIQTPPLSTNVRAQYVIPTSAGLFDVNFAWTHTGNYYASADNGKGQIAPSSSKNDMQKLIDVFNGSIGWTDRNSATEARVWVKNLTDVRYWSYADEISFATFYSPAPPRTYGVTFTRRFQ